MKYLTIDWLITDRLSLAILIDKIVDKLFGGEDE